MNDFDWERTFGRFFISEITGHKHWRLEQCIGKRVKIVFKDGNWCEGILAHKPNEWRYGMNGCDWHSSTDHEKDHHIFGWFLFCHSNVRVIQEVVEDGQNTIND